ncbi:MAG: transposase [Bdellovibrio sp.]|nr:transposase [Bdellovibrio sp.]
MIKEKFTEEPIIKILKRNRNGEVEKRRCRVFGIASAIFYRWKNKFGDMTVNEAKIFIELEQKNSKLIKIKFRPASRRFRAE